MTEMPWASPDSDPLGVLRAFMTQLAGAPLYSWQDAITDELLVRPAERKPTYVIGRKHGRTVVNAELEAQRRLLGPLLGYHPPMVILDEAKELER